MEVKLGFVNVEMIWFGTEQKLQVFIVVVLDVV